MALYSSGKVYNQLSFKGQMTVVVFIHLFGCDAVTHVEVDDTDV